MSNDEHVPSQDTEHRELVERFVDAVEYLNRQVRSDHLEEWQGLEMTVPQVKTMVLLGEIGPSRMGTISVPPRQRPFRHDEHRGPAG